MKQIPLTQGQVALVDDADYDWLNESKWCAVKDRNGNFYATRGYIQMHRQILGLGYGDKRQGDHQNHNTVDNRRSNVRICTNQQNAMNRKKRQNTSSKFKGVTWNKYHKKWYAAIRIDGKKKHLGCFVTEELAALAYDKAAIREYGEFSHLNF